MTIELGGNGYCLATSDSCWLRTGVHPIIDLLAVYRFTSSQVHLYFHFFLIAMSSAASLSFGLECYIYRRCQSIGRVLRASANLCCPFLVVAVRLDFRPCKLSKKLRLSVFEFIILQCAFQSSFPIRVVGAFRKVMHERRSIMIGCVEKCWTYV